MRRLALLLLFAPGAAFAAFNGDAVREGFVKLDDLRLWLRIPAQGTATNIRITLNVP